MKTLRVLSLILLLINGLGAFIGGFALVNDPSGETMHLCLDCLEHSPFENYFIPGLILLLANGILDLLIFGVVMIRHKSYPWLVAIQGSILTGWIVGQMILLQVTYYLQFVFAAMGILLIIFGLILVRRQKRMAKI